MQNRLFVLMKAGPRSTLITAIITKATGKLREEGRVRKTLAPPLFWPISLSLGIFFDSPQLSVSSTFKSFDLQNTPAWQGTNLVNIIQCSVGKNVARRATHLESSCYSSAIISFRGFPKHWIISHQVCNTIAWCFARSYSKTEAICGIDWKS